MSLLNHNITPKGHLIRAYDYVIIGVIYFIFGMVSSFLINLASPKLYAGESEIRVAIEIILEIAVTILFSYIINRLIERLPIPMAGDQKTQAEIIDNIQGGIVAFAMFTLQVKLRSKIQYFFYGKVEDRELVSLGLSEI